MDTTLNNSKFLDTDGMSRRKVLVVQMDDALTDERPDRCKGTELTILNSAQSLLKAHN